jgi:glucose/arabinose dehydrogenase
MTNSFRGACAGFAIASAVVTAAGTPAAQQPATAQSNTPICQPAGAPARGGQAGAARGAQPGGQGAQAAGRAAGVRAGGGGGTPPPIPWPAPPLADGPITLQTAAAAHRNIRLIVMKGLTHPWGMAFLPDGSILVTERPGCLRIVRNGVVDPKLVAGLPPISAQGLAGLLDVALHPRFAENKFVYLTYHKPNPAAAAATPGPPGAPGGPPPRLATLARGVWDGNALTGVKELFSADVTTEASRIVFGRDGMIYMSLGRSQEGANAPSQDPNNYGGKLLRLRDDGSVPPDNPFVGRPGYRPEIYSMGHRNQLGLAVNPSTGELWASEQGPNGGDEVNIIRAGKNYGWPVISYGRSYPGPRVSEKPWQDGMEQPVVMWIPSIALSGMTFYTGDKFPGWKGSLFVGGLRQGEVPRTGQLQRIEFNDTWEEVRREPLLRELGQRIRDVRQGPDGYLYVLTEENDAALIRIEPGDPAPAAR